MWYFGRGLYEVFLFLCLSVGLNPHLYSGLLKARMAFGMVCEVPVVVPFIEKIKP